MKEDKIFELIADIDEKYIAEARTKTTRKNYFVLIKWGALAACLCLLIAGVINFSIKNNEQLQNAETSTENSEIRTTVKENTEYTEHIESTETTSPGGNYGGASFCSLHSLYFHLYGGVCQDSTDGCDAFYRPIYDKNISHDELLAYTEELYKKAVDDYMKIPTEEREGKCRRPGYDLVTLYEHFGVSKEELSVSMKRYGYNSILSDEDIEVLFSGDDEKIDKWARELRCNTCKVFEIKYYYNLLLHLPLYNEKYKNKINELFEEIDEDTPPSHYIHDIDWSVYYTSMKEGINQHEHDSYEFCTQRFDAFDGKTQCELCTLDLRYYYNSEELCRLDYFVNRTIASIIKELCIERTDAESLYNEHPFFNSNTSAKTNGEWGIDFDKLYGNLDYYASLLGEDGYEYSYLVDAEYSVKQ